MRWLITSGFSLLSFRMPDYRQESDRSVELANAEGDLLRSKSDPTAPYHTMHGE